MASSERSLYRILGSIAYYVEKYPLAIVYFYFSWVEGSQVHLESLGSSHVAGPEYVAVVSHVILFLLQFSIGIFLLISRKPSFHPSSIWEIVVPLAAMLFFMVYRLVSQFPPTWRTSLLTLEAQTTAARIALILGLIGPAISAWGVFYLGRSFGIFVSVRNVVLRGPYRFVRHPIYLGYLFVWTGFLLVNFCPAVLVIIPVHALVFLWRALLEEKRLAEASPDYREYLRRTGFLFPRLGLLSK